MPDGTLPASQGYKVGAGISMLLGVWLFVSPWVYRSYHIPNAWNSWIVGILLFVFAAICYSNPAAKLASTVTMLLAIWTFVSPWIFGYTADTGRFVNSLCVGVVVFILSAYEMSFHRRIPIGSSSHP